MGASIRAPELAQRRRQLAALRARHHPGCILCGEHNRHGLHVDFRVLEDGSVAATTVFGEDQQGYAGTVHGGMVSTLLDGALTNCLFSHGVVAVTGELTVRMLRPVVAGAPVQLRAWLENNMKPLFIVRAELIQHEVRAARAMGKFMDIAFSAHQAGNAGWPDLTSDDA